MLIGFLIEHYAGKFPVWLAPEHARVIPIGDSHNEYAERIVQELKSANLRVSGMNRPQQRTHECAFKSVKPS